MLLHSKKYLIIFPIGNIHKIPRFVRCKKKKIYIYICIKDTVIQFSLSEQHIKPKSENNGIYVLFNISITIQHV